MALYALKSLKEGDILKNLEEDSSSASASDSPVVVEEVEESFSDYKDPSSVSNNLVVEEEEAAGVSSVHNNDESASEDEALQERPSRSTVKKINYKEYSSSPYTEEHKDLSASTSAVKKEKPCRSNVTKINYKEYSSSPSVEEDTDSSASTSSFNSSESDSDDYVPQKKKKSSKENRPINIRHKFRDELVDRGSTASALEAQRRKNIEARMQFFKELSLDKAKKDLEEIVQKPKKVRPVNQESTEVRPKSSRIRAKQIETKLPRSEENSRDDHQVSKRLDKNQVISMSDTIFNPFNNADFRDYFQRLYRNLQDKNALKSDVDLRHCSMDEFQTKFGSLTVRTEQNMKLLPSHITSLKFHPSQSAMLIAAGGKSGTVGLWNVNVEAGDWDDSNIIVFELHSAQVNCISFSNYDPDVFFTSSADGNLYKGNLIHQSFQLLYSTNKSRSPILYHSEQNVHTLYIAREAGGVTKIDTRMRRSKEENFRCHHDTVRTLCMSPTSRYHMLTCSDDANVSMWDLRAMTKQGLSGRLWNFTLDSGVASAFLSPLNGTRILVTLPSNTVCIYDTHSEGGTPFRSWEVQLNGTKASRPATYPFKAMWHPQREDFFCIGRNSAPYGVDVFRCNYSMGSFSAPRSSVHLETQRCTLAEFHPSYPAVATSSSTNVHVFL